MKKILTVLLFCILTVGMASVASAEEWRYIGGEDGYTWFFDTQSFQKVNDTTYSVQLKLEYNEATGRKAAKEFKLKAPLAYVVDKSEFNFHDKKIRALAVTYYDKKGNVLNFHNTPTQWASVFPNDMGGTMLKATYTYYKQHYK